MSQTEPLASVSLGWYSEVLRRSWKSILALTAAGLAAALLYLGTTPRQATATASVSVNVISTDPFSASRAASGLIDTAGESQIASSYTVSALAADRLGEGFTPESVRRSVEVTGVGDTAILRISATARTADEAQSIANAVADEFLVFRSEQAQTRIARTLAQTNERLDELRSELRDVDERIAGAEVGSREETLAQSDRSLLTLQINALLSQAAVTESIDTTGGTVLSPADRNPVTWTPQRGLILATATFAGFGLGVVAAFLLNALRSRVTSDRDVHLNGGGVVLGELTLRRATVPPQGTDLAEYRTIRERVLADPQLRARTGVLVVIDVSRGGNHIDVPLNLAYVIAHGGVPAECVALGASTHVISELATQMQLRRDTTQVIGGVRLRAESETGFSLVIPPPPDTVDRDEFLSPELRNLIATRRDELLVVVPVPYDAHEATRLAACRIADYAVLLTASGATLFDDLRQASEDVRNMGAVLLGSLLIPRRRRIHIDGEEGEEGEDPFPEAHAGVNGSTRRSQKLLWDRVYPP